MCPLWSFFIRTTWIKLKCQSLMNFYSRQKRFQICCAEEALPVWGLLAGHRTGGPVRVPEGKHVQAVGEEGKVLPGHQEIRHGLQVLEASPPGKKQLDLVRRVSAESWEQQVWSNDGNTASQLLKSFWIVDRGPHESYGICFCSKTVQSQRVEQLRKKYFIVLLPTWSRKLRTKGKL